MDMEVCTVRQSDIPWRSVISSRNLDCRTRRIRDCRSCTLPYYRHNVMVVSNSVTSGGFCHAKLYLFFKRKTGTFSTFPRFPGWQGGKNSYTEIAEQFLVLGSSSTKPIELRASNSIEVTLSVTGCNHHDHTVPHIAASSYWRAGRGNARCSKEHNGSWNNTHPKFFQLWLSGCGASLKPSQGKNLPAP